MLGIIKAKQAKEFSEIAIKQQEKEERRFFNKIYRKKHKELDQKITESSVNGLRSTTFRLETDTLDVKKLAYQLRDELIKEGYSVSLYTIYWGYGDSLGYEIRISW